MMSKTVITYELLPLCSLCREKKSYSNFNQHNSDTDNQQFHSNGSTIEQKCEFDVNTKVLAWISINLTISLLQHILNKSETTIMFPNLVRKVNFIGKKSLPLLRLVYYYRTLCSAKSTTWF